MVLKLPFVTLSVTATHAGQKNEKPKLLLTSMICKLSLCGVTILIPFLFNLKVNRASDESRDKDQPKNANLPGQVAPQSELQRRSSKVLEKRSLKSLLLVGNLYHPSTTLGLEPVSIVHYTRPSSIERPTPKLISYTTPCKLACCLPRKQLHNHESSIGGSPPKSSKILCCNSALKCQIKLTVIISGCSFSCFMF